MKRVTAHGRGLVVSNGTSSSRTVVEGCLSGRVEPSQPSLNVRILESATPRDSRRFKHHMCLIMIRFVPANLTKEGFSRHYLTSLLNLAQDRAQRCLLV